MDNLIYNAVENNGGIVILILIIVVPVIIGIFSFFKGLKEKEEKEESRVREEENKKRREIERQEDETKRESLEKTQLYKDAIKLKETYEKRFIGTRDIVYSYRRSKIVEYINSSLEVVDGTIQVVPAKIIKNDDLDLVFGYHTYIYKYSSDTPLWRSYAEGMSEPELWRFYYESFEEVKILVDINKKNYENTKEYNNLFQILWEKHVGAGKESFHYNNYTYQKNDFVRKMEIKFKPCQMKIYVERTGKRTYGSIKERGFIYGNILLETETYLKLLTYYDNEVNRKSKIAKERSIVSDSLRFDILKRDNYRCVICGRTAKDGVQLHVDHIIPLAKGGRSTLDNLQTLCERCNLGKGTKGQ